jgi:transposase-like protein
MLSCTGQYWLGAVGRANIRIKAEAVRLVRDEGKTVAAAARALDLAESALRLWVRDAEREARRHRGAE